MVKEAVNRVKDLTLNNEIVRRVSSKTPSFWKKMRTIGLVVAGVGTLITTAPLSLPVGIVAWGGYLITAGGVLSSAAQLTKE